MLGHLYSPGDQRGPWPWMPYGLDNKMFTCWDRRTNAFDEAKAVAILPEWRRLLFWAQTNEQKPLWAIVPDVPGQAAATFDRWSRYAPEVIAAQIPLALAVQNGMTVADVRQFSPAPAVICVGGNDEWKWGTVEEWAAEFDHVHLLRCNSPKQLHYLKALGIKSTDGSGWNRGDRNQTGGLEDYCRQHANPITEPLTPHACRAPRCRHQMTFA